MMLSNVSLGVLHQLASLLLEPVVWGLLLMLALAVFECGIAMGERLGGIAAMGRQTLLAVGRQRIERADFVTRIAPMLGLMGTLIPLGPGLAALGDGELQVLTTAMITAFDTTVIGLLAGMIGFVLGRLRRRWYDQALMVLEQAHALAPLAGGACQVSAAQAPPHQTLKSAMALEVEHG